MTLLEPYVVTEDCLPGLLDGWTGPMLLRDLVLQQWCSGASCRLGQMFTSGTPVFASQLVARALDTREPEARDHLHRALARATDCATCRGASDEQDDRRRAEVFNWSCPACGGPGGIPGTSYLWLLEAEVRGRLTPGQVAACWWCAAHRVRTGITLRDVALPWVRGTGASSHFWCAPSARFNDNERYLSPADAGEAGTRTVEDYFRRSVAFVRGNGSIVLPMPNGPTVLFPDAPPSEATP